MRLKNKNAVITGAQQGIGKAIVEVFADAGAAVVINYLDDRVAAEAIAEKIFAAVGRAETIPGDIIKAEDIEAMMGAADELGGVDILVNNAGIFPRVDFLQLTPTDWDRVHDTNLKAGFFCAQAAARRMIAAGRPGAIVNIASAAAHSGPPLGVHYAASKAGIIGMSRAAAMALAPHGIRVNALAPGLTDTAQPRDGGSEEEIAALAAKLPLGRIIKPVEIAEAALFLASDQSNQMTGQVLHINGGQLLI